MRRLTGWIGGALGGITAYRLLRRVPPVAQQPERSAEEPDERADELRAKLAESRAAEPTAEPVVEEQSPVEVTSEVEVEPEPESPAERRRRVHEEGRAALDEMKPE
jgi:hypothetical protein